MSIILVDTNVLLYLYDHNSPVKQDRARQVLSHLLQFGTGRLSAQTLGEFMQAVTRKLVPPLTAVEACEQLSQIAAAWTIFDLTQHIVLEAARGVRDHHLAYYDAQIWATARLHQVPIIFSEDYQDGQNLEGVRFINPFTKQFKLEDWV